MTTHVWYVPYYPYVVAGYITARDTGNASVISPPEAVRYTYVNLSYNVFSTSPLCSYRDAFDPSQGSECLWLLHYCSILHCDTHCSIRGFHNSRTIRED